MAGTRGAGLPRQSPQLLAAAGEGNRAGPVPPGARDRGRGSRRTVHAESGRIRRASLRHCPRRRSCRPDQRQVQGTRTRLRHRERGSRHPHHHRPGCRERRLRRAGAGEPSRHRRDGERHGTPPPLRAAPAFGRGSRGIPAGRNALAATVRGGRGEDQRGGDRAARSEGGGAQRVHHDLHVRDHRPSERLSSHSRGPGAQWPRHGPAALPVDRRRCVLGPATDVSHVGDSADHCRVRCRRHFPVDDACRTRRLDQPDRGGATDRVVSFLPDADHYADTQSEVARSRPDPSQGGQQRGLARNAQGVSGRISRRRPGQRVRSHRSHRGGLLQRTDRYSRRALDHVRPSFLGDRDPDRGPGIGRAARCRRAR